MEDAVINHFIYCYAHHADACLKTNADDILRRMQGVAQGEHKIFQMENRTVVAGVTLQPEGNFLHQRRQVLGLNFGQDLVEDVPHAVVDDQIVHEQRV